MTTLRRMLARGGLCVLAVAPFWSLYVHHFMPPSGVPTGFILIDMPTYCANGRAVFERGNGLAYPHSGNPDPQAAPIYFHWLAWVLGFGIVKLGVDPGIWLVAVGAVAGLLCAWLTLRIVETVLPDRRYVPALFLVTMWGGGVLALCRAYENLLAGNAVGYLLFAYDPEHGWWFLNWGRNLLFPTEATYHAVVAACWLAVLRDAWGLALVAAAAIALTHPFTGFQTLLILLTWGTLRCLVSRTRGTIFPVVVVGALLAAFLAYNLVFLESYEEHRSVRAQMSLAWGAGPLTQILAYGPVGFLAVCRLALDRDRLSRCEGFLLTAFVVSILLANHHHVVEARQPLHFMRGYIWMPLWLLALPLVQRLLIWLKARLRPLLFHAVAWTAFAVAVSDNAAFVAAYWREPELGIVLTREEWDVLDWLRRSRCRGVFVSTNTQLTYLASTYTSLRPLYDHWLHTPYYRQRLREADEILFGSGDVPWIHRIDDMVVPKADANRMLTRMSKAQHRNWQVLYANDVFAVLGREEGSPVE